MEGIYLEKNTLLNKVVDITILFWIIKIISTTVGKASADFFAHQFGSAAVIATLLVLVISIIIQIKFKRYVPWIYWAVIILLLVLIFAVWYLSEKTLDVLTIYTTKREIFYWIVIFFTFALGTAAGDLVAGTFHFGLLDATLIFGVIMVIAPILLYVFKVNNIALFWISYILTRPSGAAGADLVAKPIAHGGYRLGDGTTSLIFLVIIVALIL